MYLVSRQPDNFDIKRNTLFPDINMFYSFHLYYFLLLSVRTTLLTGNPNLKRYASSTLRNMGVCADHFSPEMFKSNPRKNTNKIRRLKMNAIPEPPENVFMNEEEEDVQASQLVIEEQLKEGEEEEERYQHHPYHYQQQQEAEEVEEEGENELFINKPTLDYTKGPLKFSDNEDSMEWAAVEPQMTCAVQHENSTTRTFQEMKLDNECAQLLKKNKNLRAQIRYLRQKFIRIKKSRDRFRKLLLKAETVDGFLDRYECKNDATRALIKSQLESESIKYTTEEQDECEENN